LKHKTPIDESQMMINSLPNPAQQRPLLLLWCLSVATLFFGNPGLAHEVRPGYLEIVQTADESYNVLWKVPMRGDLRLGIYPRFPDDVVEKSERRSYEAGGAHIQRWSFVAPGGLTGEPVSIEGLTGTMTDVLVRLERSDGTTQVVLLSPSRPSFTVEDSPDFLQVVWTYLRLGIEHILLGIDHLLFVLALLIIAREKWTLLKTVTAFTVAHSITLGLAALGFVHVPSAPVEAVIALSIVFVASEILHGYAGRPGLTARAPWIVAFSFGLLHGFGFAGALSNIGLPEGNIPLALLCFNLGVEFGQLMFIGVVLVVTAVVVRTGILFPQWTRLVPPYAIGGAAMFWVIERVAAF